ncbi:SapC family protein [Aurantimonas sp. VKM B-3413]|uniref:SapC family protein n=1 Tax=Aurantimonas sp. VKM B-3413 TaxID=2779401 RepID=UPI001E5C9501|nr:SapC family protein [Aurantimonas sp. VKM B-3413]MCB8836491.1 SapC family protein [Aurantimonas sp. VKM B-3413]
MSSRKSDATLGEVCEVVPIASHADRSWRPASGGTGPDLFVPIGDSELLLCSHFLPLAILPRSEGAQVVALLSSAYTNVAVYEDDAWQPGYKPIALRCLPFGLTPGSGSIASRLTIRTNHLVEKGGKPLFGSDGTLAPEVKATATLLARWEAGANRLAHAADRLMSADLLLPVRSTARHRHGAMDDSLLTIDLGKLTGFSKFRAAALARPDALAVELAAALKFSLRSEIASAAPAPPHPDQPSAEAGEGRADDLPHERPVIPLHLDEDELLDVGKLFPREQ